MFFNNINKQHFLKNFKMVNIEFVGQLVDSMSDAVLQLEQAITDKKADEVNKLRAFIFDLHRQITGAVGGKNV